MMSPLQIEIVLHHYYTPASWRGPLDLAATPGFRWLVDSGLLRAKDELSALADESPFEITDMGRAYVTMLITTPLPRSAWVDPRTSNAVMDEQESPSVGTSPK